MSVDHFDSVSDAYARHRPGYPAELFTWLASIAPATTTAWDCACGNGQASVALAAHFDRVVGTDAAPGQITSALAHPRVEYRAEPSERSILPDSSVDLVTVAQALHWLDIPATSAEFTRVLRPGGVIAAWSYAAVRLDEPELDEIGRTFHDVTIGPYWPPERAHVNNGYRALTLPGAAIPPPAFAMTADWTLDELVAYCTTWSGVGAYRAAVGSDPVPALRDELALHWGPASGRRTVRWPLTILATRLT